MNVCWIISQDIPAGFTDPKVIKDTAPSWGSWSTWKEYKTSNCICTSATQATNLIQQAFHAVCTLYIMQESYAKVGKPLAVKLFKGVLSASLTNKDDIVATNLASPQHDIVLMLGFDFSPILNTDTKAVQTAKEEYYFNMRDAIKNNSTTQFVLVDYKHELASWTNELDNVSIDTMQSVIKLLG